MEKKMMKIRMNWVILSWEQERRNEKLHAELLKGTTEERARSLARWAASTALDRIAGYIRQAITPTVERWGHEPM